ncbi:cornifelin homolog A-like [Ptychodera flava]|uniref:cornifelin homolog A-like n=1 Tax=Ptychodera flava TaxID=63121 RepID=UPI00396A09B3
MEKGATTHQPHKSEDVSLRNRDEPNGDESLQNWNSDVFYCVSEMRSCLCGCFFFPCFQCELAQRMGEPPCVGSCWPCGLSSLRGKMRYDQKIEGNILRDVILSICCGPCVACQLSRELDYIDTQKYYDSL